MKGSTRPLMSRLLPPDVAVAEVLGGLHGAHLFSEEASAVRHATEKRRREFTVGRTCARRALMDIGYPPVPILSGPSREPIWPPTVAGSITHCEQYTAAAVARCVTLASIGIDAEVHEPLPPGILDLIASEGERMTLATLPRDGNCWDRLLFSAKESVFKAWFPLTQRWLDFQEAVVMITPEFSTFSAKLLVHAVGVHGRELTGFEGNYLICKGLVLTAVAVRPVEIGWLCRET